MIQISWGHAWIPQENLESVEYGNPPKIKTLAKVENMENANYERLKRSIERNMKYYLAPTSSIYL